MTADYYTSHHGLLLKKYIVNNGINKGGGLNKLIDALGVTRQAIYVMYEQKEIKAKNRKKIIEHLKLPANFFPKVQGENNSGYIIDLQKQFIKVQGELLDAHKKINQLSYSPKLHPIVIDAEDRDRIVLVPRKAIAGYTKNYNDALFISKLQTFSLPHIRGGFAFEIEGDSMNPSNINHKDFVVCNELVEKLEQTNPKKAYVVVLNTGDIVCKLIRMNEKNLTLISTNKEYKPYNVGFSDVQQIWKVQAKYTPNIYEAV